MKKTAILFLGYPECRLLDFLHRRISVFQTMRRLKDKVLARFDLAICFGYRHILRPQALMNAARPPINLHISYLPFNRGADPNYWSFQDDTPKGVTIHKIDNGVDSGPIMFRRCIEFAPHEDDLASTYARLISEIQDLFIEKWERILIRDYTTWPQPDGGSYHSVGEMPALPDGWKSRITRLGEVAER